ncbi:maleylpyruvate isomerase N-terminal domain-containing protein [Actinomadura kijaniata]|uniref:maleylpyruvate isomerase N-terminal domain-containing protein n=1 Tax=Actinomadura kijaniata TaxID=46161 RepID=UPI003F1B262C
MVVHITADSWAETREYLRTRSALFTALAVRAAATRRRATADWSVTDTAAHVATLARACCGLVDPGHAPGPFTGFGDLVERTVVDTVDEFNEVLLERLPDRTPRELARATRRDVDHVLRVTEDADPTTPVSWLGGSRVPLAGVLAHLLNEFQVHGRDIANAARLPWRVPPREAAPFFEQFLVGVTDYGYGRLLDGHGPPPRGRVAVEFRSAHTTPVTMALTDGFATVERPDGRPDVRLSFDPTALNLMLFGRVSKARAVLTGKVVIRGPRPWKLPGFLRIVRLPS